MDITETLAPKSDQLNAEDLLTGPRIFTVDKVTKGSAEQPVNIHLVEFPGRPFKPSKTVRRILVAAWGAEASNYTGRQMMLYRDPSVKYGGMDVGGIRVSALSHISEPLTLALTETRGKRKAHRVEPLREAAPPTPKGPTAEKIIGAFQGLGVTAEQLEQRIGRAHTDWTPDDLASLAALGKSIKDGSTTVYEEFEPAGEPEQGELGSDGAE